MNLDLASAWNVASANRSRASRQYRCLHVPGSSEPVLAAGACHCQHSPSSLLCTSFAEAVPAGAACRGHVCVGVEDVEILQWGSC